MVVMQSTVKLILIMTVLTMNFTQKYQQLFIGTASRGCNIKCRSVRLVDNLYGRDNKKYRHFIWVAGLLAYLIPVWSSLNWVPQKAIGYILTTYSCSISWFIEKWANAICPKPWDLFLFVLWLSAFKSEILCFVSTDLSDEMLLSQLSEEFWLASHCKGTHCCYWCGALIRIMFVVLFSLFYESHRNIMLLNDTSVQNYMHAAFLANGSISMTLLSQGGSCIQLIV